MPAYNEQLLDERHRLLAMREYLRVRAEPETKEFESEVVGACLKKVSGVIEAHADCTGEVIVEAIARVHRIRFEEVKTPADIKNLEQKYLVEQRELGFGRLSQELSDPNIDALLFQRLNASDDAPDRFVAVINVQGNEARAYWSRPHEIVHRLAEPPQKRLPFFRHRHDAKNRVERIVDLSAAELAFPRQVFGPLVKNVAKRELTWELVKSVRQQFAPTSSLLASAKAFLRSWPLPAYLLTASVRGRRHRPGVDVALRINVEGFSPATEKAGLRFFPNMRVPPSSPMWRSHKYSMGDTDRENLSDWTTSSGTSLPSRRALTSSVSVGPVVYGFISLE